MCDNKPHILREFLPSTLHFRILWLSILILFS